MIPIRKYLKAKHSRLADVAPNHISIIGETRTGKPIPVVSFGPEYGPACVVVAGMHSAELTGVCAALNLVEKLSADEISTRFHVVPAVDLDGILDNARIAGRDPTLESLLTLRTHRDLENRFSDSSHVEAQALRKWLENLPRIDAFLSLHAANQVAPGSFVYLGGANERLVGEMAQTLALRMDTRGLSRLLSDPTGLGGAPIADGVFGLPHNRDSSVDFVQATHNPSLIAVTEFVLAQTSGHDSPSLEQIGRWTELLATGQNPRNMEVTVCIDRQIGALGGLIADVAEMLQNEAVPAPSAADGQGPS